MLDYFSEFTVSVSHNRSFHIPFAIHLTNQCTMYLMRNNWVKVESEVGLSVDDEGRIREMSSLAEATNHTSIGLRKLFNVAHYSYACVAGVWLKLSPQVCNGPPASMNC